ncbi:MAG: hypothetical protein HGB11_13915 [Chlorobiales bacterium]|nr:hypothetical protein [Chlorobiales bacterium]
MPTGEIFEKLMGKSPKSFQTIEEINEFIEKRIGKKLKIKLLYEDISSCRGSILPLKSYDPEKEIDNALKNDRRNFQTV